MFFYRCGFRFSLLLLNLNLNFRVGVKIGVIMVIIFVGIVLWNYGCGCWFLLLYFFLILRIGSFNLFGLKMLFIFSYDLRILVGLCFSWLGNFLLLFGGVKMLFCGGSGIGGFN